MGGVGAIEVLGVGVVGAIEVLIGTLSGIYTERGSSVTQSSEQVSPLSLEFDPR